MWVGNYVALGCSKPALSEELGQMTASRHLALHRRQDHRRGLGMDRLAGAEP